jgi:hypothetical protein
MTDPKRPAARGRPVGTTRAHEPGSTVSTWVPTSYHERLVTLARERNVRVSALIRELLTLRVPTKPREP